MRRTVWLRYVRMQDRAGIISGLPGRLHERWQAPIAKIPLAIRSSYMHGISDAIRHRFNRPAQLSIEFIAFFVDHAYAGVIHFGEIGKVV